MTTSCADLLEALDVACEPDVRLTRTTDLRRFERALGKRTAIRNAHFAACVKALEADLAATRHPPSCHECQAGEWCEDRSNLVIQASGLRNDALVAVRRDLEAAVEHADGA